MKSTLQQLEGPPRVAVYVLTKERIYGQGVVPENFICWWGGMEEREEK